MKPCDICGQPLVEMRPHAKRHPGDCAEEHHRRQARESKRRRRADPAVRERERQWHRAWLEAQRQQDPDGIRAKQRQWAKDFRTRQILRDLAEGRL